MTVCDLSQAHCRPCEGGLPALETSTIIPRLAALPGWQLHGKHIEKRFEFRNHHEAMAFVNALAWISHREDHHPETVIGYREVRVCYWTHAIDGLSENDLICAAKVEQLFAL